MEELVHTAGSSVVGSVTQLVNQWTPATLLGSGKVEEIGEMIQTCKAQFVVVDHQLTGVQTRNLEKAWAPARVFDRAQVIIFIFSQRARSFEGKLQVELAQCLDQLPRMVDAWMGSLSRQGGGDQTKGPGETALELDRRQIRKRITSIRKKLVEVEKNRKQHRSSRKKNRIPSFALMGYTNSGKSTLMNRLTQSDVYAKDQLFATLDPTTRKAFLNETTRCVVTDTVGFIDRLPHHLIEAFKSTLEESSDADILLHTIDLSNPFFENHMTVVEKLIEDLKWQNQQIIHVFNKTDQAPLQSRFKVKRSPRVFVSAKTGEGMEDLKEAMIKAIDQLTVPMELLFPLEKQHLLFELEKDVTELIKEPHRGGILCKVKIIPSLKGKWGPYTL